MSTSNNFSNRNNNLTDRFKLPKQILPTVSCTNNYYNRKRPRTVGGGRLRSNNVEIRPNTVSGARVCKKNLRPNTVSGARIRKKSAKKNRGRSSRRSRPHTSPVKGKTTEKNKFTKSHGKKSLVYDESTIQLAKWSVAVDLFDKKDKSAKKKRWETGGFEKQRPQTSPTRKNNNSLVSAVNKNVVYPPTNKNRLLKTEHTLNQEILALVAQRTLAQELMPVYNMTPHNALNPREEEKEVEYLTKEETLARKRIEHEEKSKEEYRRTHVKGEFKMLDVRTHKKIFRPFIAQEQRWLMKWGSSKFKDMRANCHIFRSLAKWEELKEEARIKYKKDRAEKIRKKKLRQKKKFERQLCASRGYAVY